VLSVRGERSDRLPLLGAAGALIAVACCAGLPAIGAVLGGLTVAAVIGIAGGVLVAAATLAAGALLWQARRRRRVCDPPREGAPR
jgi:hypothetical protein